MLILVNHEVVIYNFRLELVERLLQERYEVWISCPYGEKIERLKALGCHYIDCPLERHGTDPAAEWKLIQYYKRIVKEVEPMAVLSYTIKPNIYGAIACRSLGVPIIANITGLGTAVESKGILQMISVMLYRLAFTKVHTVFFQNTENRKFFETRKIALGKHKLIPGSGVNLQQFLPSPYQQDKTTRFVFVGRVMKEKGIDHYLDAAEYICSKHRNVQFHVCGFCEEEYAGKLNACVSSGTVTYHGMIQDVAEIYKQAHCVVLPSYHEGMSNVLLEATACARPIIATDCSGCREVIDEGVNGFLIKPRDTEDLIRALERFLALPHEEKARMGRASRQKVEKGFDRQIVVSAYLRELEEIRQKTVGTRKRSVVS